MYRDAKEELKRLEDALLQVDSQPEETANQWDIDIEDAISDIPDLPRTDNKNKIIFGLTIAVIALTAAIVGLLVFIFVRYGEAFL